MERGFGFRLIDGQGKGFGLKISFKNSVCLELLNTLCGTTPVEWLGTGSHSKIFELTSEIKESLRNAFLKVDDLQHNGNDNTSSQNHNVGSLKSALNFIDTWEEGILLAFLREGCSPREIKKEKGKWIANEEYWGELATEAIEKIRVLEFKRIYDIFTFGDKKYKEFTGPTSLKDCICRYCNESGAKKFKKENAHAIPHALGNELVFCNDECKVCNGKLSPVDKELTEYLKYRRSENRIRNKNKKIIQVHGHNFSYDGNTDDLIISKEAILKEEGGKYFLKLEGAEPISHLGIYKGLAKIAIDLMPRDLVNHYSATIRWIKGEFIPPQLPDIYYTYWNKVEKQPKADLFIRNEKITGNGYPRCMMAIRIMDLTFFLIVPLGDNERAYAKNEVDKYLDDMIYCIKGMETPFFMETIEMDDRIGKFAHVTMWCKKTDCKIVDQSELPAPQEKNPNIVDFPELDESKIIPGAVELKVSPDVETNPRFRLLKIEDSYIELIEKGMSSNPGTTGFFLSCRFKIIYVHNPYDSLEVGMKIMVNHSAPAEVSSPSTNELSSQLAYYILQYGCESLKQSISHIMKNYDFDRLAEFIMESSGHIMNPK